MTLVVIFHKLLNQNIRHFLYFCCSFLFTELVRRLTGLLRWPLFGKLKINCISVFAVSSTFQGDANSYSHWSYENEDCWFMLRWKIILEIIRSKLKFNQIHKCFAVLTGRSQGVQMESRSQSVICGRSQSEGFRSTVFLCNIECLLNYLSSVRIVVLYKLGFSVQSSCVLC